MGGGGGHGRMRKLAKKPSVDAVRNDINVTPLVDVVLVLLIIFMVITPMLARGKEVPLPETSFHADKRDFMQPVISIGKKGDGGEVVLWLAGMDTQGKQELVEMGSLVVLLDEIEKEGGEDKMVNKLFSPDPKVGEIARYWSIAQKPEAQNKVFFKVQDELEYEQIYPILMQMNEMLGMDKIELATAERMGT
jgi:biopolymer transport protein ExbD